MNIHEYIRNINRKSSQNNLDIVEESFQEVVKMFCAFGHPQYILRRISQGCNFRFAWSFVKNITKDLLQILPKTEKALNLYRNDDNEFEIFCTHSEIINCSFSHCGLKAQIERWS